MKNFITGLKTILVLVSFFILKDSFASAFAGGELTYQYVSSDTSGTIYNLSFVYYRDCSGIAAPNGVFIYAHYLNCSTIKRKTLYLKTNNEVTIFKPPICTICNGCSYLGYKKVVYEDTIFIPNSICTENIKFQYFESGIGPLNCWPSSDSISIEAYLNNKIDSINRQPTYKNSSPQYLNDPVFNIPINIPVDINFTRFDQNDDSLDYSFTCPLYLQGNPYTYPIGLSSSNPFPNNYITLNNKLGTISTYITQSGSYIIAVKTNEYNNNVLVGSSTRFFIQNIVNINSSTSIHDSIFIQNVNSGVIIDNHNVKIINNNFELIVNFNVKDSTNFNYQKIVFDTLKLINVKDSFFQVNSNTYQLILKGTLLNNSYDEPIHILFMQSNDILYANQVHTILLNSFCFPNTLLADAGPDTVAICDGSFAVLGNPQGASGGLPPYLYTWSNATNQPTCIVGYGGKYTLVVLDQNGCRAADSTFVVINPTPNDSILLPTIDTFACSLATVFSFANSNNSNNLIWNFGDGANTTLQVPAHQFSAEGNYNVSLISSNNFGCSDTIYRLIQVTDDCVYPGDADNNGLADNNDLLAIGLAYNATGAIRQDQSITWDAHFAMDWADTTFLNINQKHADCDGNGLINNNDTTAIYQNWGLTHNKSNHQKAYRSGAPTLNIELSPDTIYNSDTIIAKLLLGDISLPASNIYGIAFTFNYSGITVDSTKTLIQFSSSWLGTTTEKIAVAKDFPTISQLKTAVTRIDHSSKNGFGEIGEVTLIVNTANIDSNTHSPLTFKAYITDLKVIDENGNILDINEGIDSSIVLFEPNGIKEIATAENSIIIYPNPAQSKLIISSKTPLIGNIKLMNTLGETMAIWNNTGTETIANIDAFSIGVYYIETIASNGNMVRKKICIAK